MKRIGPIVKYIDALAEGIMMSLIIIMFIYSMLTVAMELVDIMRP